MFSINLKRLPFWRRRIATRREWKLDTYYHYDWNSSCEGSSNTLSVLKTRTRVIILPSPRIGWSTANKLNHQIRMNGKFIVKCPALVFTSFWIFSSHNEPGSESMPTCNFSITAFFFKRLTISFFFFFGIAFIAASFKIHDRTIIYKLQRKFRFSVTHVKNIASPQTLKFYEGGICGNIFFLHVNFVAAPQQVQWEIMSSLNITFSFLLVQYFNDFFHLSIFTHSHCTLFYCLWNKICHLKF